MLFITINDFYIPFIVIILFITYQISFNFFYEYYKIKDEKIKLNKILIAFGILFGIGLTGIVIRIINTYYVEDLILKTFLINFTHILIAIAIITFQVIVSSDSFNEIIKTNLSKAICIFTIIMTILILIFQTSFIQIYLIVLSILVGAVYMFIFHINLILITKGSIKKRFIIIFLGEILLLYSVIMGAEEIIFYFNPILQYIIQITFIPLIILNLLIIFFGAFNFPVFMEFNWKEKISKIYIVDKRTFNILYTFDFTKLFTFKDDQIGIPLKPAENQLIFSRGIIGINAIISGITNNNKIEIIHQDGLIILLKHGDDPFSFLLFCLIVKKEMNSINYFFKTIKSKFQEQYKNILPNLDDIEGNEVNIFKNFDETIKNFGYII